VPRARDGVITLKLLISGRVQGVSFRATLRDQAILHGVDGWVRNLQDGSVEALLQGEEADVRAVADWARVGPRGAEVSSVAEERLDTRARHEEFTIVA